MNIVTEFKAALPYMRFLGYDPFAIYIQAVLESGNFTSENAVKRNNFFNSYHFPGDGWEGECYTTYDKDKNGKLEPVQSMIFPTPLDTFKWQNRYVFGKFPQAYIDRKNYKLYYHGIMTIKMVNGKLEAVPPSYCVSIDYEPNLINLYERKKKEQPDLYEIIQTDVWQGEPKWPNQ